MLINLTDIDICHDDKCVLSNVDFHVEDGEFVYLIGKVGTGKSSLLKTLYADLPISRGDSAQVLDYDLLKIKRKNIPDLRKQMGIVFQDFQLLPDRTVEDNLDFVLKATGCKKSLRKEKIDEVLTQVGLIDKAQQWPHELSGGEQQRVSIARALLNNPRLILADEPTGNLDAEAGRSIVRLLRSLSQKGAAVVMSTHNLSLLDEFPGIVYEFSDGHIKEVRKGDAAAEEHNETCANMTETQNEVTK